MNRSRMMALGLAIALTLPLLFGAPAPAAAQAKPDGEMRFAMYVTISPTWFDPGEVIGFITPFWLIRAMHDALVKTMPGKAMAPSLAESWTVSADQKTYDFKLRAGLKFPNGDPFTAEDVKFSWERAKGAYGGWPELDALFKQQGRETDRKKREALLHQVQLMLAERMRFAMIYDYVWPSGVGPRVAEPALLLIDPYPWAAPYEELRLKK